MSDNSRSATPISSPRCDGTMIRAELSGSLGILVKADKVGGQPPHRPHEQVMQREIDQSSRQGRDPQRDQQQVAGKPVHRLPQRRLIDHDLDELPVAGSRPDHADRMVAGREHGLERIDDRGPLRHGSHVDVVIDRRRQTGAGQKPALLPHLDGDRARADAGQDLPRQRIWNHAQGRRVEHQRRGVRRRQPVVQPIDPEIRNRRHVNQNSRDHDQGNGEQQQFAGQAKPARRQRPRRFGGQLVVGHGHGICLRICFAALRFRMRFAPEPVKLRIANVRRFPI